jgi:hypothetical protein
LTWVESTSAFFRARHDAGQTAEALRVLELLEATRARMAEHFPRPADDLTVVLHASVASLLMARPQLAVSWLTTAPAARRYLAGTVGRHELHLLSFDALQSRASAVPGSREMLARSAPALYARRVVLLGNHDLQSALRPARPALACAGRGSSRAPPAGSPGRPNTPGRPSPGACARGRRPAFRRRGAMRPCSAGP